MKTKTLYWILGAWITFLAISMLTGCKTKSVEVLQAHDTLRDIQRGGGVRQGTDMMIFFVNLKRYYFKH